MDKLWAPWRMEYILSEKDGECVFCKKLSDTGHHNYILKKGEHCFIIMNIFPYNNGHLLVLPKRHVANLEDLSEPELVDIMKNVVSATSILRAAMSPQGFNIGLNLGKTAGAGIAQHLHWHIVPRWAGDVNFMPVLGETRVISQHLEATYNLLMPYFREEK